MFVELHILQNFAPANLNRDDTGAPKDCEFGGYRRARISSQALKRATRWDSGFQDFIEGKGGVRTRRLVAEIAEHIASKKPAPDSVITIVSEVFKEGGLERQTNRGQEEEWTKIVIFISRSTIQEMVSIFKGHWNDLTKGSRESRDLAGPNWAKP